MRTIKKRSKIIRNTKKYIIETARSLFSNFSYLNVSMNDIAKKLKITKAALYYHFKSKKEIYKKVLEEVFKSLNLVIFKALKEKKVKKKIYKLIKDYLNFGLKEKNLIKVLMLNSLVSDSLIEKYVIRLRERIINLIQPLVKKLILNKKLTSKIDSKLTTSLLICLMDGLILEYSLFNKKIDLEKISNQILKMFSKF